MNVCNIDQCIINQYNVPQQNSEMHYIFEIPKCKGLGELDECELKKPTLKYQLAIYFNGLKRRF